jgi:hypothetical protein
MRTDEWSTHDANYDAALHLNMRTPCSPRAIASPIAFFVGKFFVVYICLSFILSMGSAIDDVSLHVCMIVVKDYFHSWDTILGYSPGAHL